MNESKRNDPTGCEGIRELVAWYPTGTLDAAEKNLVETHTATCAACADRFGMANRVSRSVAAGLGIHLEPDTLVAYVEEPDSLPAELRARTELHLSSCPTCRREMEMLQAVDAEPASDTAQQTEGRLRQAWEWLTGSILQPVPAAVYLTAIIALIMFTVLPSARHDSPVPDIGSVLLLYDTSSEVRGAATSELPVFEIGQEPIVVLEFTNLQEPPVSDAPFEVTIAEAVSGTTAWQTSVLGALFADNYTLALTLDPAGLTAGRYVITVLGPDREQVFLAEFVVR